MKNLYALNEDGKLIHVSEVDKTEKRKYICCECKSGLIARKGKIKAHHFSHKDKNKCNYESYLHKVSKQLFFEIYTNCLKDKLPFFMEYKSLQICNSCEKIEGINHSCSLPFKIKKFDLTKRFDEIYIEKGYDGFIADILLKSSISNEIIFIEFAVTHKCEKQKIQSQNRIIEFNLTSEIDLKSFTSKIITQDNNIIEFYNFRTNEISAPIYKPHLCQKEFVTLLVLNDGRAIKRNYPISKIYKGLINNQFLHFQILKKLEDRNNYAKAVQNISDSGVKVINCYACRFRVINKGYNQYFKLFCKKHRGVIKNSNHACKSFWRREKDI